VLERRILTEGSSRTYSSTSGKTYEDPCPIQTRRDKRIESESHAWARIGKNIGSSLFLTLLS